MASSLPSDPDHVPLSGARAIGAALESHYRFLLWLVPAVERFPRRQKFLLGDSIQATALDVLERLIEATYTKRRSEHLRSANRNRNGPGNRNNNNRFRVARTLNGRNRQP